MSTFRDALVVCLQCEHRFSAEVAEAVHAASRADLRAAILAGEFHRFECPRCHTHTTIEKLLAYTDFDRSQWFVTVPAAELPFAAEWLALADRSFQATMLDNCPPLVRETMAPRMLRRVVFGLASLREKILLFDAGLDDRACELMKLRILQRGGVAPSAEEHLHLLAVGDDALELAHARAHGVAPVTVPRRWYAEAAAQLDRAEAPLFAGQIVDYRLPFVTPEAA